MKPPVHLRLVHSERTSAPTSKEMLARSLRGNEIDVWLADADEKITHLAAKLWSTVLEVSLHHANADMATKTRQIEDVREWREILLAEKTRRGLLVVVPRPENT